MPSVAVKPSRETLEDLYLTQRLSQEAIGRMLGISQATVGKWLRGYGVKTWPFHGGAERRGVVVPAKEELHNMIHVEFLSYREIGDKFGVTPQTVFDWVTRLDVAKPSRSQAKLKGVVLDEATVKTMYEAGRGMSYISETFRVSQRTVHRFLISHGIERREAGFGAGHYQCSDGMKVRSSYERTVGDWLISHCIPFDYEPRLPFGRTMKADFRANGWYLEIWGVRDSPAYDARKSRKLEGYKACGLPLISFHYLHFIASRRHRLEKKLNKLLIPA